VRVPGNAAGQPACCHWKDRAKGKHTPAVWWSRHKPYHGLLPALKDAAGKVIALLFMGNDISVFEGMFEKQVAQTRSSTTAACT
jgi:hypothetical protein